MGVLVWIKTDGSRHAGDLNMKPFIAEHYPVPEPGKILFVPFPKLRVMGVNVRHVHLFAFFNAFKI